MACIMMTGPSPWEWPVCRCWKIGWGTIFFPSPPLRTRGDFRGKGALHMDWRHSTSNSKEFCFALTVIDKGELSASRYLGLTVNFPVLGSSLPSGASDGGG